MSRIIVAGGLGTLGRAVVERLAAEGAQIVVVDVVEGHDPNARAVLGGIDLADAGAVAGAYAKAAEVLGGVDGLVNVAGGFIWETMADGSDESWDRMYRMNLRSAAVSCRAILRHLGSPGGAIVNVGAAAATRAAMGMAPYAASKAGVMALTESLADELRSKGIRVNAVLPTILDTPANRTDMPDADVSGWVSPAAAASVIAFLISAHASCVTGEGVRLSMGPA